MIVEQERRKDWYDWKGEMDFARDSEVPVLLAHRKKRGMQ